LQDYELIRKRGERGYDVVIILEVDSMYIDNLAAKTQITKLFSGYQSLYTFYYIIIYVFTFIAFEMKLTRNKEDIENKRDIIKRAILQRLENSFYLDYKDEEKNIMINIPKLITRDNDGKVKLFEVDEKNVFGILYPNCLKEEIEAHLENWIDSVITSFSMIESIDYIIYSKKEKYKKVIPIDFYITGVYQANMAWNEVLYQILQIINDVEIFPENVNTNSLLVISFFKKYKELYGITGAIGSKVSQGILQNLYNVELYFIPPKDKFLLKKRSELFFSDEEKWENKIINEIKEIIIENRSVLLICRNIVVGDNFVNILKKNGIINIKKYFTLEHQNIVEEVLEQKYVIIATNLAGRETFIRMSKDLEEAGGLHVILSFIPINQRVEDQNLGRVIRNGQKGSYSFIFMYKSDNPILTIESIRKKREVDEREKVKYCIENKLKEILKEEELFNDYCKYRKEFFKKCKNEFIKEDNEYLLGKIFNSKECFEKKKKMLEDLKKRSLREEDLSNPLIKIKFFIENIDKFNENDKNLFEKEKFYSWSLKMEYATYLVTQKIRHDDGKGNENEKNIKEAIKYYEDVIEKLKDFQNEIQNQTNLLLCIFKTLSKINNSEYKKTTRIEAQNERKKKILEAIIDINKQNSETLKKFQNEKSNFKIDEELTIPIICKKKLHLYEEKNQDEIEDLKYFIKEFGIDRIKVLRIVNI